MLKFRVGTLKIPGKWLGTIRLGTLKIRGKWLGKIPVGHAGDPRGPRCLHRRVRSRGMKAIRVQTPLKIRAQVVGHDPHAAR